MNSLSTAVPSRAGQLQGRHVLAALVLFFAIVFAVNGYFLFAALSTYSGEVAIEPYRKGLAYNARIVADERQSQLGWKETLTVATSGALTLALRDRDGVPVPGLVAMATIGRPATTRHDRSARLVQDMAGRYVANLGALEVGNWIVTIEARSASSAATIFRSRRRLWLRS